MVGADASVATRVIAGLADNPELLKDIDLAARQVNWDPDMFKEEVREKELNFRAETDSEIERRLAADAAVKQRNVGAEKEAEAVKEASISKLKQDLLAADAKSFI